MPSAPRKTRIRKPIDGRRIAQALLNQDTEALESFTNSYIDQGTGVPDGVLTELQSEIKANAGQYRRLRSQMPLMYQSRVSPYAFWDAARLRTPGEGIVVFYSDDNIQKPWRGV